MNIFNILTCPITKCFIYFCFSNPIKKYFYWQIDTYLLTYLLLCCVLEEKEISWTLTNSRMKIVHFKKASSLLDGVHLFAIQNEVDGSLQHVIGTRYYKHGWRHYYSFKETNIKFNLFLLFSNVFYNMFMLYWSSRVESVLILNIAYFLTLLVRKCLHILLEQRKS